MHVQSQTISAGEFKAKCLHIMDQVGEKGLSVIITKRGKPVAKLVPVKKNPKKALFGYLKNSLKTRGDIISPISEQWSALGD